MTEIARSLPTRLAELTGTALLASALVIACAWTASLAAPPPTVRPGLSSENPSAPVPKAEPHFRYYHWRRAPPPPPPPPPGPPPRMNASEPDDDKHICSIGDGAAVEKENPGATCIVEIIQTLQWRSTAGGRPTRVAVIAPGGVKRVLGGADFKAGIGMTLGDYRFEATLAGRLVRGVFTVRRPSRRVLRISHMDSDGREPDTVELAGYSPRTKVKLYEYARPTTTSGSAGADDSWKYEGYLGELAVNDRGEATFDASDLSTNTDRLIVSEPRQQNSLTAARIVARSD